jgi:hypothetical protein
VRRLPRLLVLLAGLSCRRPADPAATARAAVHEIAAAVNDFHQATGRCPGNLADLVAAKKLARADKDPWNNDYVITCPGNYDLKGGADVTSPGPDHELGNHDDVNSWE